MNAIDLIEDSLAAIGDSAADFRVAVAPIARAIVSDPDIAWAAALVAAALGPPAQIVAPDLAEVHVAVAYFLAVCRAKVTRYYRIGDSSWAKYTVVAVAVSDAAGPRAILFPMQIGVSVVFDYASGTAMAGDAALPWPPFVPPLLRLLVSEDCTERNASGFVAEDLVVKGDAKLPPDATWRATM